MRLFRLAPPLLFRIGVKTPFEKPSRSEAVRPPAAPPSSELFEGGEEFLEELTLRLNEIIRKPNGRFVICYVAGRPGAKTPPRIQ